MLYLAIDQHAKQITVCVRNHDGDTVLRRQVSTRPEKIEAFFQQLTERDTQALGVSRHAQVLRLRRIVRSLAINRDLACCLPQPTQCGHTGQR